MNLQHVLFAVMSIIWGLTWVAIKIGVTELPPFFFAAARFVAAGAILYALAAVRGEKLPSLSLLPRLFVAAILVNTACYGFLFWGMQHVATGVSAVVNLALIPVALFLFGLVASEERYTNTKALSLVVGVVGLGILFYPKLSQESTPEVAGMAAIVAGTLTYCLGSVLSRPLLVKMDTMMLSACHTIIGGAGLIALSLGFERVDTSELMKLVDWQLILAWLFLVVGGSVIAFTIYLRLLHEWEPSRAGLYAFVSPVIALVVGVAAFGESLTGYELVGSVVMLGAAFIALPRGTNE